MGRFVEKKKSEEAIDYEDDSDSFFFFFFEITLSCSAPKSKKYVEKKKI